MKVPVLLFAALSLDATLSGQEQEKKSQCADLPAPAEETVDSQSQGATAKVFSDGSDAKH